jgi:hypothetical protein
MSAAFQAPIEGFGMWHSPAHACLPGGRVPGIRFHVDTGTISGAATARVETWYAMGL